MKSFRIGILIAVALLGIDAFFFASFSANAKEPEKPTRFSGYLLDSTGLDVDEGREASWRENFESPGVSWRYLYRDGDLDILEHRRVENFFHSGKHSEFLQYEVETPGVVAFGHYVDYPSLYDETAPSLWLRSDRPGVALAALVVFPKTLRPDTNKPLTAILPGDVYEKTGEWQQLKFPKKFGKLLENAAQAIRGEHKIPVDSNGAYIRQIVLLTEARSGRYSLWIDDLEIAEHIRPNLDALRRSERGATFDPIDLLGCRLRLSKAPIFAQNDGLDSDVYGVEPFAVDAEKVALNRRKRLSLSVELDGAKTDGYNADRTFDASNASQNQLDATPSFDEALAFLPATGFDRFAPNGAEIFANSTLNGFRRTAANSVATATPTMISRNASVGQVGFVGSDAASPERVASASYLPNAANSDDGAAPPTTATGAESEETLVSGSGTLANPEEAATESFARPGERLVANARFRNGFLETDDKRTYGIRAIEYQGESFDFLKQLGFNAVLLNVTPTERQIQDANRCGVWLIAPAPIGAETLERVDLSERPTSTQNTTQNGASNDGNATDSPAPLENRVARPQIRSNNSENETTPVYFNDRPASDAYDATLLWLAGLDLKREDVESWRRHAAKIRNLDLRKRPLVGGVVDGVDDYTQGVGLDAIILTREPFQTSLDLNDYAEWLISFQHLTANPSVAFWNRIQTQPAASTTRQRQYFGALETPGFVSYEQMRQQVRLSMRAKCRGLIFASKTPLDRKDRETQYRAAALELVNLELRLINPWFAMGDAEKTLLETSDPTLSGLVSRTARSVLVAPISVESNAQYAMGADAAVDWSGTVATKEGYSPDLLVPGALRKIVAKRRAGGSCFTLDDGGMNSLLFFTQSDALVQTTTEKAPLFGDRMAELAIKLAKMRLDLYEQTAYRLQYVTERGAAPKSAPTIPNFGSVVSDARAAILEAEKYREQRDDSQAYLQAEKATREIREAERRYWLAATRFEVARPVTPLSTSFYDMPAYLELYEKINSEKIKPTGPNLIRSGEMEDPPNIWQENGWRLSYKNTTATTARTTFEAKAAHSGNTGLVVAVSPQNESRVPIETEAATAVLETEFPANAGKIVCIQGWIKIPTDLTNSIDGVKIYDDQGGEALALRFKKATGWKRFAFYRLATIDGPMRIRFEFRGIGEVWLDDVAARIVE